MQIMRTLCVAFLCASFGSCAQKSVPQPVAKERPQQPTKVAAEHLPNAYQIHPRVISGGLPEGEEAFLELAQLGVRTVVSVDGAQPDVEGARKHGLRYVHLPHGYDGIPALRARELAKAVRDLPGPVYIHCHHGKHRSPAAAAVACVAAGLVDPTHAELILLAAGTSEHYRGLYQAVRAARRIDAKELDRQIAAFPERAAVPPLAEAMVALEQTHERLRQIEGAGWKAPAKHPDLEAAHEALLLREHYTELLRLVAVQAQSEGFRQLLAKGEAAATELEEGLRGLAGGEKRAGGKKGSREKMSAVLAKISKGCVECHQQFRDVPLSEKGK